MSNLLNALQDQSTRPAEIDWALAVFDVLDEVLGTSASKFKYLEDTRRFYGYLIDAGRAVYNPLDRMATRFGWDRPDWDNPTLDRADVTALYRAARTTEERLLVIGLAGWELRHAELCALHIDQLVLPPENDEQPYIQFADGERKNGPRTVALLVGVDVLDTRLGTLADRSDWDGYLFPSSTAASGHIVTDTIRNRFTTLAERAGVTVDGEVPTDYAMVDEFQDSSEIQFKLTLLLAGTNNLCVVGDWKQSIYGFQYTEVENITAFEDRLDRFVDELNADHDRVTFNTRPVHTIELVENYRSTQEILDFSEHGLLVPAASRDDVDVETVQDRIISLSTNAEHENTQIEAIASPEEHESVVAKIQEIVGNDSYQVEADDGSLRTPEYRDVAVLTRTREFGRDLLQTAEEYGLPMAYGGGIELFRTPQAKLLLAWLRILESDTDRGWAVILEEAGYTLDEIKHILETKAYPENMRSFREKLAELETLGGVAERVFSRYGYDGATADVVLHTVQSVHTTTTLTRGDLIRFIERGIEAESTHDVHANAGANSVTVQTIHAAKGLVHPIVVLANMNSGRFPPSGGGSGTITFQDPVGLRQRKRYAEVDGLPHVYDDWRTDVLRRCLPREYDEERRLLYVAITRAESHVIFSAGKDPNTFLEELPVEIEAWNTEPDAGIVDETEQTELLITVPTPDEPVGHSPHSLMREDVFEDVDDGMGKAFGTDVHDFAEAYARGDDVELNRTDPSWGDKQHVMSFLDGLSGDLLVEEDAYLPLVVDGTRVMISGIIDLIHVCPDRVEVVDYKTDRGRHAEAEYRKQLSVYYHVLRELYPERDISASIFYTVDGVRKEIDPLLRGDLADIVTAVSGLESAPTVQ